MASRSSTSDARPATPHPALILALIVGAVSLVFGPALRDGWIFDDEVDILFNPLLRSWDGLVAIWTHPTALYDFYPLKNTVQWVQWQLWHQNPFPYHLTNIALHVISALLIWRVATRLGVKSGWIAALLFAVHPLVVESVAWNAELKNTLSLPPLLLSLIAFLDYQETGTRRAYVRTLLWFVVSLLCKTSGAPLPMFLLLYGWWRKRTVTSRDVFAVLPLCAVALVLGTITLWFQHERGMIGAPVELSALSRLLLVGSTWWVYLLHAVFPVDLMPVYPQWDSLTYLIPSLLLPIVVAYLWRQRLRWGRHALLTLGWFLLFIAPASGLFAISYMRFTWVMDHMAYVALVGLTVGAAALVDVCTGAARQQLTRSGIALLIVGACVVLARPYARAFQSDVTFWSYALRGNPRAWIAHNNLGVALGNQGDGAGEVDHLQAALALKSDYADAHANLGDALLRRGELDEALPHFQRAVALQPNLAGAYAGVAKVMRARHRTADAASAFATAVQLRGTDFVLRNEYAQFLAESGQTAAAIEQLRIALDQNPAFVEGRGNLGLLLQGTGHLDEAVAEFEKAVATAPDNADLQNELGGAYQQQGRHAVAIPCFKRAVTLRPDFAVALYNLGISLYVTGEIEAARPQFARARTLDPNLPPVNF